jgi:hypothetical protein
VEPISQDRGRDLVTATYRGGIVAQDFTLGLDIGEVEGGFAKADHFLRAANEAQISLEGRGISLDYPIGVWYST